ncbi:S-layer homology domain-containing protein [Agathobaculum sp. Marseille-P7918]|uniref:S-layer homology domain-containing protein n=1 Tax=Agathobaculum sp. Marseille-P7918 TaxID=2479843 RepID=UPI001FA9ED41|nr:S-layer homology domain-containing protein [Agathobaculum sp. Marseille-P7918]
MNQKKVLALVLAFACAFTMFAGAAFTDEADFAVDTDVVDTLVALGVINGYTDGSFQPDATVTRAEMAKMIYVIRTGRSDASAYNNDATTFTDITDHWARGYIKYCQSLGIIAGKSATSFDPDATVTTQEAAKMLLVTLGYNADNAGLVGTGWGAKTTALADENGLLEDVNCGTTQGMPRQYAAQLMYNAIFAPTVVLRDGEYTNLNVLGVKNPTIGEKYMDLNSVETTVEGYTNDGVIKLGTLKNTNGDTVSVRFNDYTVDRSELVGREVRVLYKAASTANGKATIYGIFEIGDLTYIDTIFGDITDYSASKKEIKVNGTTYDVANGCDFGGLDMDKNQSAQPVTVTLNEDGDVYKLTPDSDFRVAQISYVGSSRVTIDTGYDIDDIELYDGYAKDDWVVKSVNDYNNKESFAKADVVTGKVEVKNGDDITIDGTVYTLANDGKTYGETQPVAADVTLGSTVDAVVVNGYIYYIEESDGAISMDDVVYLNGVKLDTSYGDDTLTARAVFADGTSKEIVISDGDAKGDADEKEANTIYNALVAAVAKDADEDAKKAQYGLYAFDMDGDEYMLSNISANGDDTDFDASKPVASGDKTGDDRIGGVRVNDNAVVFVKDSDGDITVLTGAQVKAWKEVAATGIAYSNESSGYQYVELAALEVADVPGASSDDVYGYVVATLGITREDSKYYASYSVWTGSDVETVKVESRTMDAAKGDFIKVVDDEITVLDTQSAVKAYDGETVTFYGNNGEYNITDDTKIIYVNTEDVEGVEGGSIRVATDHNVEGSYEKNAVYVADTQNNDGTYDLLAIFIDVNNELDDTTPIKG